MSNHSNGRDSNGSLELLPLPNDFMHYFPYACGEFECGVDVCINKMIVSELQSDKHAEKFVDRYEKQAKPLANQTIKSHISRLTIRSEQKLSASGKHGEKTIVITIVYNLSNRLTHITFHKAIYFPRKMIRVLRLIIHFYPYLTSITLQHRIDRYVIYELSRLLDVSNIVEVCLDGCTVKDGNYDLFLNDNNGVRILSLARCSLADPMVKLIAKKLVHPSTASKTLLMLNLTSNRLTDESAEALAYALHTNRSLRNINLADNAITDKGALLILNTMLEYPISAEEITKGREQRFQFLKAKAALTKKYIDQMTFEETEKYKRMQLKSQKHKLSDSVSPAVDADEPIILPSEIHENIQERASVSALSIMGEFNDPFHPVINKKGVTHCCGNNSLQSLNLAYNNLTILSVKKIIDVIEYQKKVRRMPRRLININIEGNRLPVESPDLVLLDELLKANALSGEGATSVLPQRKRLQPITSKASVTTYSW